MSTPAIPAFTTTPNGTLSAGTAFLGELLGTTYLVTAAHLLPLEHPTADWSRWGRWLKLVVSDSTLDLELFLGPDDARVPVFGYFADHHGFSDALWVPLPVAVADHLGQTHQIHSLMAAELPAGELVTVHGYPTARASWPPEIETVGGPVIGISTHMMEAQIVTETGFSGGPVMGGSGAFAGMLIGSTDDRARIVPAVTLRTMILNSNRVA